MNRKYTYFPEFVENDCLLWHVYENTTQQVIDSFVFEDDAVEFMEHLETGNGFDGFTPSFILQKATITKDINEAFSAEFA